ncbi:MAG TPA: ATP-binding protein [Candidatus Limnocylindrales bacterium]|nr:ATP-binding protein [Candidatus Limnocylindrales bacterium]
MANAELLSELVRAHYAGDERRFTNLLNQVIASESKAGHVRLAQRLRELRVENESKKSEPREVTQLARAPRNLEQYLSVSYSETKLDDLVLALETRQVLHRLVVEQRASDRLASHGLRPRRRLLLHGPPGCGKTMAAHALAGELRLPIIRVRIELIFSRYLGETAATLTDIFEETNRVRGVYLFDEFDALGSTRSTDVEVGEVKRVVSTFLQLLDADRSDSVLVAATNIGATLDKALFRRFDDVVYFPGPTPEQAREMLKRMLKPWKMTPDDSMVKAAQELSFDDIRAAVEDAMKAHILDGRAAPAKEEIEDALRRRIRRLSN